MILGCASDCFAIAPRIASRRPTGALPKGAAALISDRHTFAQDGDVLESRLFNLVGEVVDEDQQMLQGHYSCILSLVQEITQTRTLTERYLSS
jgi:hypothetical protein